MASEIPAQVALNAAVQFEQRALRSRATQTCADCGDPGTVVQGPTRYCHVAYYFCDDCNEYWNKRKPEEDGVPYKHSFRDGDSLVLKKSLHGWGGGTKVNVNEAGASMLLVKAPNGDLIAVHHSHLAPWQPDEVPCYCGSRDCPRCGLA